MPAKRLQELGAAYDLSPDAPTRFEALLDLVAHEPTSITSVRAPSRGADAHVADSLSALVLPEVRRAERIADLGSGAGFPGLVLAIALPGAHVTVVDSVARKGAFLRSAIAELGLGNAEVVVTRAEAWSAGIGVHDLVTARALAPLAVIMEYAAPLLCAEGALVAWKADVDAGEEAAARVAAELLGLSPPVRHAVEPVPGATNRSLYLDLKVGSTPNRYPRRPGMARKHPLGASTGA